MYTSEYLHMYTVEQGFNMKRWMVFKHSESYPYMVRSDTICLHTQLFLKATSFYFDFLAEERIC